jgi:hypothetical protein
MEIQKQVFLILNELRNAIIEQIERNDSVFKGHLKASVRVTYENGNIVIRTLGYGRDVEYGRLPGKPISPEHLKEWCRLKLGDENAAYPIAKKIFERGIEPRPFITPVIHQKLPKIIKEAFK